MRYLLLLALAFPAFGEEFLRAYTEPDGVVCFDLPESLVDVPPGSFEHPTETALPAKVSTRQWLLLSTKGVVRLRPARLRVVDANRQRTSEPPRVRAKACTSEPVTGVAAFVVEANRVWRSRQLASAPAAITRPEFGARSVTGLVRIERPGRTPLVLMGWKASEESCEKSFSLFEMGRDGTAAVVADNSYDCDI